MGKVNPETNNFPVKKFTSIHRRLMFWSLMLVMLPLLFVSWFNYQQTKISLSNTAADQLQRSSKQSVAYISRWFENRQKDVRNQAELNENVVLLQTLRTGFEQSGKTLVEYVKSSGGAQRVKSVPNGLAVLNERYDYIYDLYLIDSEGNILYTVAHESDWGTNLFHGVFSQTKFAHAARQTLETGQLKFSGMERYFPSNQAIAGFMTVPVLDESGEKIGVFAIQFSLEHLFDVLPSNISGESSVRHYMVGADGYIRTPLRANDWHEVLARKVTEEQLVKLTQDPERANTSDLVFSEYIGPEGRFVIGDFHKISLVDITWNLVSEINVDEALRDAYILKNSAFYLLVATFVIVMIVASIQSRYFIRPLTQLVQVTRRITEGDSTAKVNIKSHDEIGLLADSFNDMLDNRRAYISALEESKDEAQQALLKLAEQQYALNQHASVTVTDVSGAIVFVNEKFSQFSGYSQRELLGKNHRVLNSGFHDDAFFVEMYRTITRGDVWHGEICNKSKAGHLYWLETSIIPFMDENNQPKNYIAIRADITDKKRDEVQLHEALESLREKQDLFEQEEKIAQHVFENITASNNDDIEEVATWCEPMGTFSGDMVLSSLLPDGGLRIILCDFTGHGLPAALGAVPVSSIYTAITAKNLPLPVLMGELNNRLNTLLPTDMFCCIAGIDLNPDRSQAHVWNAGLPDILLLNREGEINQRFTSNHLPLGVTKYQEEEMHTYDVQVRAGDSFYIYSDGLTEAENIDGEMFGQYRLEHLLKTLDDSNSRLEMIKKNVIKFVGDVALTDDVSLLEIKTLVMDDDNLLKS